MIEEAKKQEAQATDTEKESPKEQVAKVETKELEMTKEQKQFVEQIEGMSVLELSKLVKIMEEKFGVSAAAPAVFAAGAPGAGGAAEEEEEKSIFNVELSSIGANKIQVIKELRVVTSLGLKEAKDLVDSAPKVVKEGATKEEAEEIKKKLEAAGAKVTLK